MGPPCEHRYVSFFVTCWLISFAISKELLKERGKRLGVHMNTLSPCPRNTHSTVDLPKRLESVSSHMIYSKRAFRGREQMIVTRHCPTRLALELTCRLLLGFCRSRSLI